MSWIKPRIKDISNVLLLYQIPVSMIRQSSNVFVASTFKMNVRAAVTVMQRIVAPIISTDLYLLLILISVLPKFMFRVHPSLKN